jgi:AraC-like DNA-binding protein/ligand-binding sensor domain-containing protein
MQQFAQGQTVEELFIDNRETLWAFCAEGTILNYDSQNGTMKTITPGWKEEFPLRVTAAYQDPTGDMWLCTWDRGVYKLDPKTLDVQKTAFTDAPGMNRIHCARNIEPYILVVGSDDGLVRLDLLSGTMRTDRRKQFIYYIMVDAEDGLWIGSYYSGIHYRILDNYRRFITYPLSQDDECIVSCFTQTPDGSMWAGSDNLGVIRFDENTGAVTGHFLTGSNVHSLLPWNGKMLVGSYSGGIDLLDYKAESAVRLTHESVYSMTFDNEGYLWFGTLNDIFRMSVPNGTPERIYESTGLVSSIKTDADGTIWCATEGFGLLSYHPVEGTWKRHSSDDGIESGIINSLFLSGGGMLIAAGDKGLSYSRPGAGRFSTIHPKQTDKVLFAASDAQSIWFTTTNGLYRYDILQDETDYFGGETGLYEGGFIAGSGFVSDDSRIWLGTYKGVSSFYPGNIRNNQYSPAPLMTGVTFRTKVRAGRIDPDININPEETASQEITMKHKYNNVTFTYAALSYKVPQRNRYMTMLEGFDDEWVTTNLNRTVYTNLPAGDYTFKVRSSNSDGIWSDQITSVNFTIRPHILQSKVAIIIYLLLFILITLIGVHLENKRVQEITDRKMNSFVREFERTEKERRTMDFEKKMREIIAQNLSNPDLSSEMLADSLFVSRSSLFAKVKEITGTTPHQLIQDARLEEAARMLSEGRYTVGDVCEKVGFNSSNYFSKCFKQKYGCNPRDWSDK